MRRTLLIAITLHLASSAPLAAQDRSPIVDVLRAARSAVDDLRYGLADSLANEVLSLGTALRRGDRIQALQIAAASQYPEEASAQHPDSAIGYLRQLVRFVPNAEMPRDLTWPGLSTLLAHVKSTTFGATAYLPSQSTITASDPALIQVSTTLPARSTVSLRSRRGGELILIDEALPSDSGRLQLPLVDSSGSRYSSGRYELIVIAYDLASPDSVVLAYEASLNAPLLDLLTIPPSVDSTRLLPAKTKPGRVRGIVVGLLIGAATFAAAEALRPPDLRDATSGDGRAATLGITLGLGSALGGYFLDTGTPIPANITRNQVLQQEFVTSVDTAKNANLERRRTYAAVLTIEGEVR